MMPSFSLAALELAPPELIDVSCPVCVYPLRTTWNGGDAKQASSYGCR